VAELGGSISAEHGIGRLKADQLHLARSTVQLDWMRRIKATVDPDGLLNPGVLMAPEPRLGGAATWRSTDPEPRPGDGNVGIVSDPGSG
jgi:hypothetical protein